MAQGLANPDEPVVLGEEIDRVRLITLNRPRQLNVISPKVVSMLAGYLEKWENDDEAELVIIKGVGRAFSAGGDLKVFYDGRKLKDSCLEVVYRMYWLCYHIHTYKKTQFYHNITKFLSVQHNPAAGHTKDLRVRHALRMTKCLKLASENDRVLEIGFKE